MTIDYAKAAKQWPTQQSNLTRAIKSQDPAKVIATTKKTVAQWDETGAWPDDWHRWQRALDAAYWIARTAYVNGDRVADKPPLASQYDIDTIRRSL